MKAKTPEEIRDECYRLAQQAARERNKDGDIEGSNCFLDLAEDIAAIEMFHTQPKG